MKHKWLTKQEIADYKANLIRLEEWLISAPLFAPMMQRLIADRDEAIELWRSYLDAPNTAEAQKAIDDADAMLKVATDYD